MSGIHTSCSRAAVATIAVLIAGCGASTPPTTTAGQTNVVVQAHRFGSCMRAHGVPSFPDPKVSVSNGGQSVRITAVAPASGAPRFQAASKACQSLLPGPVPQTPTQRQARTRGLVSFARCVRAHGVSGFPDPTPQGQISPAMLAAGHVEVSGAGVQRALFACVPAAHGILTAAAVREAINHGG